MSLVRLRLERAVRPPARARARAAGRERVLRRRADARPHPLRPARAAAARPRGAAAVRARRARAGRGGGDRARASCSTRAASTSRRWCPTGASGASTCCARRSTSRPSSARRSSRCGPAPRRADEPRELAWDLLVDGCERVLAHAARQRRSRWRSSPSPGCSSRRWPTTSGSQERLGHPPALGLTLDIGHIVCLEPMSVTECVRRGAPTLAHVHIEDMKRGVHEHLVFGDGRARPRRGARRAHRGRLRGHGRRRALAPLARRARGGAAARWRRCARPSARWWAMTLAELSAALEARARPKGSRGCARRARRSPPTPTAIRTRFPMVGRKVGREPLEAGADPADVHAWTIDDAARTLLLVAMGEARRGRAGRALPLRRRRRAPRHPARAAVPGPRRPRPGPDRRRDPHQRHAADRGRARPVRHRAPAGRAVRPGRAEVRLRRRPDHRRSTASPSA